MSNTPVVLIQERGGIDGKRFRVRLSLPHNEQFRVRSSVIEVKADHLDDFFVDVESGEDDEVAVLLKSSVHGGEGGSDAVRGVLAVLTQIDGDAREKDLFVGRLANDVDRAFASAVFDLGSMIAPPVELAAAAGGGVGGALRDNVMKSATRHSFRLSMPRSAKEWLIYAVVLIALVLIGLGVVRQLRGASGAEQNDLALGGPNAALEAKIKQQIDNAVRNPESTAGYNGMNVALATMRAMGLNPGKANAGCLVGLGK